MRILTFVVLAIIGPAVAYNRPSCDSWPNDTVWQADLASALSADAILHGPIIDSRYEQECTTLGTDSFAISSAADGICMHAHACAYEFCTLSDRFGSNYDLPEYIVEVKSQEDIQAALKFASTHNISVSIKTTGHSYVGSSTAKNSLLIWMQNYPKDGSITTDFQDSCGTDHGAVLGINGGETWNDAIEAVGEKYHIVTGGGRTVSAAGGWLQGSGLSFTSRLYGLGVDQVKAFDVVLANGTAVRADACSNPELFFALRGGGGGTYGVVTKAMYQLYPVQPFILLDWGLLGAENAPIESLATFVDLWIRFWIEWSPKLDPRWAGGFFGPANVHLYFAGTIEEAKETFLDAFDQWFNDTLTAKVEFSPGVWGAFPPRLSITEVPNWYQVKGARAAYNNPDATDPTGDAYEDIEQGIGARLMPFDTVVNDPNGTHAVLMDLIFSGLLGVINYYLGGNINNIPVNETGVHPAHRSTIYSVFPILPEGQEKLRNFIPNNVTGICYNHHNVIEPDWRNASWGANYERNLAVKKAVDPNHLFNCWHCVGYQGPEEPQIGDEYVEPDCPTPVSVDSPADAPVDAPVSAPNGSAAATLQKSFLLLLVVSVFLVCM